MEQYGAVGVFALIILLVVGLTIFGAWQAKKRREALVALAATLGLRFNPEKNQQIASQYQFLDRLSQGSNRYAYNTLWGTHQGHAVMAFDYHYETYSTDSKGRTQTNHHNFSFFILTLSKPFPELRIGPESFLSKIAQAVGYDDIDFESHEFSSAFCVRSPNKKFAYDFCNARMIEHLLENPDLAIEVDSTALAFGFNSCLAAADVEKNLSRLVKTRSLMPNYLFDAN